MREREREQTSLQNFQQLMLDLTKAAINKKKFLSNQNLSLNI